MRLTCPNCGAQYEVPDEVIPTVGRDVQCSNCGNTWFYAHPDSAAEPETPSPAEQPEPPEPAAPLQEDAEPSGVAAGDVDPDRLADDDEDENDTPELAPATPVQREMDPAVAGILRQEAEREAKLRAAEGLESQPDLGLESGSADAATTPAQSSGLPVVTVRGQAQTDASASDDNDARRGMLPDIDELNSSLRASDDVLGSDEHGDGTGTAGKRGGFTRGFVLVLLLLAILVLIYSNSVKISQAVPQAAPVLDTYVSKVDQGRIWLDGLINSYIPK